MSLRVALVIDGDASGAKKASTEAAAAVDGLAARGKSAAEAMTGLNAKTTAFAAIQKEAAGAAGSIGKAVQLTTRDLAQMQFQLHDIAVGLASGQAPFMVLMQQGSQMVQMFGAETGVLGALRAVGSGLVSFLANPLNLALIGFSAVAGAASWLFSIVSSEGEDAGKVLERHEQLIQKIKGAWPEAGKALQAYAREADIVLLAGADRDIDELKRRVAAGADAIIKEMSPLRNYWSETTRQWESGFVLADQYEPFRAAFDALKASAAAGTPDVRAFVSAVASIRLNTADPEVSALADSLADAAAKAYNAQRALPGATAAIHAIGGAAAAEARALTDFTGAMQALRTIALPRPDDRAQALAAYNTARRKAADREELDDAFRQYSDALKRIAAEEDAAAAAAARGEAATLAKAAASREAAHASAAAAAAEGRVRQEIAATTAEMEDMRRAASGAFVALANDIRKSATAGEILLNVLNRIADWGIKQAGDLFGASLFGPAGSASGGLLGSFFGPVAVSGVGAGFYHTGGIVGDSSAPERVVPAAAFAGARRYHAGGLAGLGPDEVPAILQRGERVIPRGRAADDMRAADGMTVEAPTTIVIQGDASEKTVALIRQALDADRRNRPAEIVRAVRDARSRRILD